jgi:hypothetical protein
VGDLPFKANGVGHLIRQHVAGTVNNVYEVLFSYSSAMAD